MMSVSKKKIILIHFFSSTRNTNCQLFIYYFNYIQRSFWVVPSCKTIQLPCSCDFRKNLVIFSNKIGLELVALVSEGILFFRNRLFKKEVVVSTNVQKFAQCSKNEKKSAIFTGDKMWSSQDVSGKKNCTIFPFS